MPYHFERGRIYRMPTHFGPAPGPRQMPAEANVDPTRSPRKTLISASFLTEASALERHIPDRFALVHDPVVTVEFHYMTDIDWLAGRGYTMIYVWWPIIFKGERDQALGRFLAVMWENLADPIITGRGEIGQPKLFAQIPERRLVDGTYHCEASWMGFKIPLTSGPPDLLSPPVRRGRNQNWTEPDAEICSSDRRVGRDGHLPSQFFTSTYSRPHCGISQSSQRKRDFPSRRVGDLRRCITSSMRWPTCWSCHRG